MRRGRLVVLVVVVVLVLGGGGFAGVKVWQAQQLEQQRADYAAGRDAAQKADCTRAVPLLSAAGSGRSTVVAANAAGRSRSVTICSRSRPGPRDKCRRRPSRRGSAI